MFSGKTNMCGPCSSQDLSGLIEIDGDNFAFADLAEEDAVPRRLVRIDEDNMVWEICREEAAEDARDFLDEADPHMEGVADLCQSPGVDDSACHGGVLEP